MIFISLFVNRLASDETIQHRYIFDESLHFRLLEDGKKTGANYTLRCKLSPSCHVVIISHYYSEHIPSGFSVAECIIKRFVLRDVFGARIWRGRGEHFLSPSWRRTSLSDAAAWTPCNGVHHAAFTSGGCGGFVYLTALFSRGDAWQNIFFAPRLLTCCTSKVVNRNGENALFWIGDCWSPVFCVAPRRTRRLLILCIKHIWPCVWVFRNDGIVHVVLCPLWWHDDGRKSGQWKQTAVTGNGEWSKRPPGRWKPT